MPLRDPSFGDLCLVIWHSSRVVRVISIYNSFKTSAGGTSEFLESTLLALIGKFYAVSSHWKILCNTMLTLIWSMGIRKCSAMPAVHGKIDILTVFSEPEFKKHLQNTVLDCYRKQGKTLRKTACLSVKPSCSKMDVEHRVFTTFSQT